MKIIMRPVSIGISFEDISEMRGSIQFTEKKIGLNVEIELTRSEMKSLKDELNRMDL